MWSVLASLFRRKMAIASILREPKKHSYRYCANGSKTDGEEALLRAAFQDCDARFSSMFGINAQGTASRESDIEFVRHR